MITIKEFRKAMKGRILQTYLLVNGKEMCVNNFVIEAVSYIMPSLKNGYWLKLENAKWRECLTYEQMSDLLTYGHSCEAPASAKGLTVRVWRLITEEGK